MLDALITSKTRLKLLLKFFLNSSNTAYLRGLGTEFGDSSNAIRQELNHLEKANLLISKTEGNKKLFSANINHPLFPDIHNLILKHVGIDDVIVKVISKIGQLSKVYLVGDLAEGKDSRVIDLWFVGEKLDKNYIITLVEKAEELIKRKIRYLILDEIEIQEFLSNKAQNELLLLWKA